MRKQFRLGREGDLSKSFKKFVTEGLVSRK